jgi:hypothetical protein
MKAILRALKLSFLLITTIVCDSTSDGDMVNVCPTVTCSEPLGDKVCFMHSGTNPVEWIKLQSCPSGYICDTQTTKDLAWYTTTKQSILGSSSPLKSPTWRKQTIAKCERDIAFKQNLLPGRACNTNYDCQSFNCLDKKCKGKSSGSTCSGHEECDAGLACIPRATYPYDTICNSLKKSGEPCDSNEECINGALCWYPTRDSFYQGRQKKCILKYSLPINATFGWSPVYYDTLKDVLYNG